MAGYEILLELLRHASDDLTETWTPDLKGAVAEFR